MNFKEEYKSGLDKVSFDENFNEKTMELIRERTPGKTTHSRKSLWAIVAIAAVFAILFSITMFPTTAKTVMQLPDKAAESVADHLGFSSVDDLLYSKSVLAMNETIIDNEYKFTLHGIVDRSSRAYFKDTNYKSNESCVIVSVERLDGAVVDLSTNNIQLVPLVKGYRPYVTYCVISMALSRFEIDGIVYCLLYVEPNLKIFADSTVCIAVSDGGIPLNAINYNDTNITYADSYNGPKAIFEVHFDPSDADHKAVEKLISKFYTTYE